MSLPRYSEYKDSGVAWLGEVPGHWKVKRLKHNLKLLTEKTERREHPVALENIESWSGRFVETETEFLGEGVAFKSGDILFGKLRPYLAKAYLAETAGEAVGDFHVMRPTKEVDGRFAQYQILNRDFITIVDGSTFGAKMPRASWDFLCNMELATPPKAEQQTIAAFLDRETGKIDALIAEQRRLVELLAEKRQAVISHAVTKGLGTRHSRAGGNPANQTDPRSGQSGCPAAQETFNQLDSRLRGNDGVVMKDSGIEWLGEVPEHWATPAMYMRYSSELGKMLDSSRITGEHLIPYMRNVDVQWGAINFDDLPYMDIHEDEYERYTVKTGDLLVCEGGEVGRTAIVPTVSGIFGYQKALHRLRALDASEEPAFMYFTLLWAANTGIFDQSGSSTITHLTGDQLRKYRFPKPPVAEQREIAAYLKSETVKFDTLIAEANRAIALLQERRSALISAAVTGKIDVR